MQVDLSAQCSAQALQSAVACWEVLLEAFQEQHPMWVLVLALLRSLDHFRLVWWERRLRCVA